MWQLTFSTAIRANIIIDENPQGFLTINNLKLVAYISHLHLFDPHMAPLYHISTVVDNKASEIWDRRGSISTTTDIIPLRPRTKRKSMHPPPALLESKT